MAHALITKWFVLSSHVFTTAGAFLHPPRAILYFLQQAAETKVTTHVSHMQHVVVCRYMHRNTREHHLSYSDGFILNLFIYLSLQRPQKTIFSDFLTEASCPPPALFSFHPLDRGLRVDTLIWAFLILQATKTHLGGKSILSGVGWFGVFWHVSLLRR